MEASVKACVFNPDATATGVESVTWSTSAKGMMSFSGGYEVSSACTHKRVFTACDPNPLHPFAFVQCSATEKRTDGTTVVHACRINDYGRSRFRSAVFLLTTSPSVTGAVLSTPPSDCTYTHPLRCAGVVGDAVPPTGEKPHPSAFGRRGGLLCYVNGFWGGGALLFESISLSQPSLV